MKRFARKSAAPRLFSSRFGPYLPFFTALCLTVVAGIQAQPPQRVSQVRARESTAARATEISQGKAVYARRCAICHYAASTAQKIGPGLKGLYRRGKFANGRKVDDAGVARWIESGGKNMPGLKHDLKPEQIRELIVYIRTL